MNLNGGMWDFDRKQIYQVENLTILVEMVRSNSTVQCIMIRGHEALLHWLSIHQTYRAVSESPLKAAKAALSTP